MCFAAKQEFIEDVTVLVSDYLLMSFSYSLVLSLILYN